MYFVTNVSRISVGIASVYGGSRTLASLADDGMAPKFLGQRDVSGRAPWAILSVIIFSNIAFMSVSTGGVNAFEWLLGLTGLAALINWGFICVSHISFRLAWKKAGRSLDELEYKAPLGIFGSAFAVLLVALAMIAQVGGLSFICKLRLTFYSFTSQYHPLLENLARKHSSKRIWLFLVYWLLLVVIGCIDAGKEFNVSTYLWIRIVEIIIPQLLQIQTSLLFEFDVLRLTCYLGSVSEGDRYRQDQEQIVAINVQLITEYFRVADLCCQLFDNTCIQLDKTIIYFSSVQPNLMTNSVESQILIQ